jgi:hypothetical protein
MKPINNNSTGCDPISSNCVIWHGADIPCINLCKGDSVTAVVGKLATELCDLLDSLNVNVYEIGCLNLGACTPKDFKELIQILIDKICENSNIDNGQPVVSGGCPDCIVNICPQFYYENSLGDTVTTMQLKDYVLAIGNKVCMIVGQIATINATLIQHEQRIIILENKITPDLVLPQITPVCVLPSVPTDLDTVLIALETEFCNLINYTGDTPAIALALQAACLGLNQAPQLSGSGLMQNIPGWFTNPINLAQSFSNLWKTVCDLRNAVSFIQNNCCDTSCNAINLIVEATLNSTTELRLDFTGTIPNNYIDAIIGSTIVLTDAGGGGPQTINIVQIKNNYFDLNQPLIIPLLGVNGANDVTVQVTYRFYDPVTESNCENLVQTIALGTETCPDLIIEPDYNGVTFSFAWNGPTPTFITAELLSSTNVVLTSQVLNVLNVNGSGSFGSLAEGQTYKIRLIINGIPCEAEIFETLEYLCLLPTLSAPQIILIDISGEQNGTIIEDYIQEYNDTHI